MGVARPPHNVTCYTQFPVKWRHDNMQNTWVTPRDPEIANGAPRGGEARNLSRRFYTSRAIQSTLRDVAGMHNAQCEYRVRPFGGTERDTAWEGTAITTADNGGQKNNRCFRAYGIARHILRTILALWCKCRSRSRRRVRESSKNLWAVNRARPIR